MSEERTSGIILRTRPLTETSLIVLWLTPDCGRISTVAKGARRPSSPFRGKLDLFFQADFSFARSRRSDLHTLREVVVRGTREALRRDLGWLQQAAYGTALVEQATETETPLPEIYQLLSEFLDFLPGQPPLAQSLFSFEMKLLNELGLQPDLEESRLSQESREVLEGCALLDWTNLPRLQATPAQLNEIRRFLHGFLIYHLGRVPKGRELP